MTFIRIGATLGSSVAGLILAERVPVAFHEAGHAVVADHLCTSGINLSNGWRGQYPPGSSPLLRFATVTPRTTAKGQTYMGETKLVLRWRDMPGHVQWQTATTSKQADGPLLGTFCDEKLDDPHALLGLARIAYLFGGRAAEW